MKRLSPAQGAFSSAVAVCLLCAGCGGEKTVNNYYLTPQLVQIRTSFLPPAVVSQAYSVTLEAAGGGGTYSWSIESGGVNDSWLTIGAVTGVLSGTPASEGSFVVIIRCADTADTANFDIVRFEQFSYSVLIKTSFVPDALLGAAYSVTIEATGGSGSYEWSIEAGGENDSWLAIGQTSGALSGTPRTFMDVAVNVRVEDTVSADFDLARIEFSVVRAGFPGSGVEENNHDGDCFKAGVVLPPPQAPGVLTFPNHADGTSICLLEAREPMPGTHNSVYLSMQSASGWVDGEPVINASNRSFGVVRSGGGTLNIEVEIESGTFGAGDFLWGQLSRSNDFIFSSSPGMNQYPVYRYSIWASRFDGSAFTPWVEIRGPYSTSYAGLGLGMYNARVIFLNTQGNSAAQGGNRAGDAVIMFSGFESDTAPDYRLYATYFDVTHAGVPSLASNPAVKYGFDTEAYAVSSSSGADVMAIGFMTDGLYMMSPSFEESSLSFFINGSHVTYIGAVWTESSWTSLGGSLFSANFDLSNSNASNKFSAPVQFATATAMDSDDWIDNKLVVTGNVIFYRVMLWNEPAGLDHSILEAADWNASTGTLQHAARLTRTDPDSLVTGDFSEFHAFGSIQGLTRACAIGFEYGYDEGGSHQDVDVMLYIFDPSSGSVQVSEIDANTGNSTPLNAALLSAEINRTSEVIFAGWLQPFDDSNHSVSLFMQAIQTTGTGRTIANSVLSAPVRMNSDYQSASGYADVLDRGFPSDMMGPLTFTSDYLRLNATFIQEPDTPSDTDNLSLHTAYIKVTPGASISTPPAATGGSSSDQIVWTNDRDHPFWNGSDFKYSCLDSGTNGLPIVYFVGDGDGAPLDETAGDPSESRLFVWDGRMPAPAAMEISGDCADSGIITFGYSNSRQVLGFGVQSAPFSGYAGPGTENNPPAYHHIMFLEERDIPGSWAALRHRCLDLNSTAPQIQQKFFPPLTLQPFTVSLDEASNCDPGLGGGDAPAPARGNTIGMYFQQGGHLYYNEYTPGASSDWLLENGSPAPRRMDDESEEDVVWAQGYILPPFVLGTWDFLTGSAVFYAKTINQEDRLFVRIKG